MTNITNETLYRYHIEIGQLQRNGSILAVFNKNKINDFYKNNGIRINTLTEKLQQIQRDNLVCDEKGVPKFTGDQAEMLEGKDMAEFNRLTKEVMDTVIAVEL